MADETRAEYLARINGTTLPPVKAKRRTFKENVAEERRKQAEQNAGAISPQIVCPHCQKAGQVHTKLTKVKKGLSGGKATGAVLTGGLSILATGLSRKEQVTQAFCKNCKSSWQF